jgi:transposase
VESELAQARALAACSAAMIQELKLEIAKLRRDKYGISSERRARLIDQLELQLEELEATTTEDALAAEQAASGTDTTVCAFTRRKPVRKAFPAHLPRERVVIEAPASCSCCGSDRIVKMGEDITETLEVIPRQWKVICYPAGFCVAKAREGRPCARSSPVGPAKKSVSLRHRSIRSLVVGPGRI